MVNFKEINISLQMIGYGDRFISRKNLKYWKYKADKKATVNAVTGDWILCLNLIKIHILVGKLSEYWIIAIHLFEHLKK